MFSKRTLEGELLIDHRAGDGISVEDAHRFNCIPCPAGTKVEMAVVTCCGCQASIHLNPNRSRPRTYCRTCDRYMCDDCTLRVKLTGIHEPFESFADRYLNAAALGKELPQWPSA